MGEWRKIGGQYVHLTQTRTPEAIRNDMRTVTDPDEALKLCRELPDAMADHGVVFYAP